MTRFAAVLALVCALASTTSCKKDTTGSRDVVSPPTDLAIEVTSTDKLWALAPTGTKLAIVAGANAGTTLLTAAREAERSMDSHPTGKLLLEKMRAGLRDDIGPDKTSKLLETSFHQSMGLDLARPAALFMTEPDDGDPVVVLPVSDPAKFAEAVGGTYDPASGLSSIDEASCKDVDGFLVCAKPAHLELVGGDSQLASKVSKLPKELRGHLELFIHNEALDEGDGSPFGEAFTDMGDIHGAVRFERGGLETHWWLPAKPAHPIAVSATRATHDMAKRIAY